MSKSGNVLKAGNNAELLSYIINSTPELRDNINLPVQGESIKPIGKIIVDNDRYRNAFINTVNLIGLTVIKRNGWENPWNFTKRGSLNYGQQVRELIADLANVYDYNLNADNTERFLENVVPNVLNYIHEVNFQKFYQTTTSDEQIAMAFDSEDGLFRLIDETIGMLYESLVYDEYLVDKYMLCRRLLDGTVSPHYMANFDSQTIRERVAEMKGISNKMTFRSPNYNPAGLRRATSFDNQILILNCEFDAQVETEVLATSFFRNDAEFKVRGKLIDSFSDTDTARLVEVLGDAYVPFTTDELEQLGTVVAVLMSDEWFMDYDYRMGADGNGKYTEFYNPTTLKNNHFLHYWGIKSTSPFENAVVFTTQAGSVESITLSPETATVSKGQTVKLSAEVVATGFVNKAVSYSSSDETIATVDNSGLVKVLADAESSAEVVITATSVYDDTITATATITVA